MSHQVPLTVISVAEGIGQESLPVFSRNLFLLFKFVFNSSLKKNCFCHNPKETESFLSTKPLKCLRLHLFKRY